MLKWFVFIYMQACARKCTCMCVYMHILCLAHGGAKHLFPCSIPSHLEPAQPGDGLQRLLLPGSGSVSPDTLEGIASGLPAQEDRNFYLFCSLLYPSVWEQCLAPSSLSINICWVIYEWLNEWQQASVPLKCWSLHSTLHLPSLSSENALILT